MRLNVLQEKLVKFSNFPIFIVTFHFFLFMRVIHFCSFTLYFKLLYFTILQYLLVEILYDRRSTDSSIKLSVIYDSWLKCGTYIIIIIGNILSRYLVKFS